MAGGRYSKIFRRVWHDEKFRSLDLGEKLSWLFLLCNPSVTQVGLYRVSVADLARGVGIPISRAEDHVDRFVRLNMIRWDPKIDLLWIPGWLKYNFPDGPKQLKGYRNGIEELLPHPFAVALGMMLWPIGIGTQGSPSDLTKKHAIIIRDACRCSYCEQVLESWNDVEIDHVVPRAQKSSENDKYEDLVASCRSCNRDKGDSDAEGFGYPFVAGKPYSINLAAHRLLFDREVRERFRKLTKGLPAPINGITKIDHVLPERGYWDGIDYQNPSDTLSSTLSIPNRFQDQDQDQDQDQEPPKAPQGGRKSKSLRSGSEAFGKFWEAYPRKVGKGQALRAWPGDDLLPEILAALEWQKPTWRDPKFVKHPSTWLNGRCWEDEKPAGAQAPFFASPRAAESVVPVRRPSRPIVASPSPEEEAERQRRYVEQTKADTDVTIADAVKKAKPIVKLVHEDGSPIEMPEAIAGA
jgi:hypothetical protein